jgi:hypothetical protein
MVRMASLILALIRMTIVPQSDASNLLFRPPLDILGSLSLDLAIRIAEPAAKRGAAAA